MTVRRVGWLAAMFVAIVTWMSCGETYRPVVIPIANTPPNPANFHAVFGINNNVAPNPGTAPVTYVDEKKLPVPLVNPIYEKPS